MVNIFIANIIEEENRTKEYAYTHANKNAGSRSFCSIHVYAYEGKLYPTQIILAPTDKYKEKSENDVSISFYTPALKQK